MPSILNEKDSSFQEQADQGDRPAKRHFQERVPVDEQSMSHGLRFPCLCGLPAHGDPPETGPPTCASVTPPPATTSPSMLIVLACPSVPCNRTQSRPRPSRVRGVIHPRSAADARRHPPRLKGGQTRRWRGWGHAGDSASVELLDPIQPHVGHLLGCGSEVDGSAITSAIIELDSPRRLTSLPEVLSAAGLFSIQPGGFQGCRGSRLWLT